MQKIAIYIYCFFQQAKVLKLTKTFLSLLLVVPLSVYANPSGFNELFTTSNILYVNKNNYLTLCNDCPLSAALLSAQRANDLLYNIQINGRTNSIRDILPLKMVEPRRGYYPFDGNIAAILKVYEERDVELIVAFGMPYPAWVHSAAESYGWDVKTAEMDVVANIISSFLKRMHSSHGINSGWMSRKLKIEPFNEFNANVSGNAYYAATLDGLVKSKLVSLGVPFNEVISSSIISGGKWDYLDWFWNYGSAGGVGAPNIHLYADSTLDGGSFSNTMARFEGVVATIRDHASPSHRVIIGEIGYPRAGLKNQISASIHAMLMSKVLSSAIMQSAEKIMFWRLLSDWLPNTACTDKNCDPVTARETTYGFINFNTHATESQMNAYFLPMGFWW